MGQFDQTVDPEEGVTLDPSPMLDPQMMQQAMPPMATPPPPLQRPTPPQAPAAPGNSQKILSMALLGLAAGLGPRSSVGAGIAHGVRQAHAEGDAQRQVQFHNDQIQYQQQEQDYLREQAIQAHAAQVEAQQQAQRQAALQKALESIRNEVKTLPNKADYDKRVEGYAAILQKSGYRMDANWLRQAIPYIAPSGKQKAESALTAFFKNPLTQQQLKDDPNAVANGSMTIDLNDDGVAEVVPIRKVMEAAGMSVLADNDGKPVSLTPGPQGGMPQIKLQALITQFKAENRRDPDPKEMNTLIDSAAQVSKAPKEPKDPEMVAIAKELAQQRLEAGRNKPALPSQSQRRVDMKSKGFEALPLVKNVQKMAEAVSFATSLDPNTKNPADDQALIYAFAKAMDPDSVVREGEYATVQKYAQSWAESFGFNAARVFTNTAFLTPQARKNMKTTITAKFAAGRKQYDNVRRSYSDQINKITGSDDGDTYLTDFGGAFPVDAAASAREKLMKR